MEQVDSLRTGKKFKKTEIGEIPVDWEVKKLIDAVGGKNELIVAGPFGSNLKVEDYCEGGIPIIRLQNIERCKFIDVDIRYISSRKAEELNYHSFRKRDIVLAKLGDPIGKTCIVPDFIERGIVVADVVRIRVNEEYANTKYIMYVLNSQNISDQLYKEIIGTTRPRVNLNQIRNLVIAVPTLFEQKKIAKILSSVDDTIKKNNEIIEKTRELKKGLMQQLFIRGIGHKKYKKTKIGEIPNTWELVEINQISKVRRGASPRPIGDPKYFSDNGRGWIRISDVTNVYKYLRRTSQYLSELGESKSVKVNPGDLIMSICATIGKPIIVDIKACIHDGFVLFSNLSDEINTEYLFYFLQRNEAKITSKRQIGTQGNLNTTLVGKTLFPKPPITEQERIARIFSSVDEEIEREVANKEKLAAIKKGLMQVLLTGKIRVKD